MQEHEPGARPRQRRALWLLVIFAMLMTPVLMSLGVWQLYRAAEKNELARLLAERGQQAPIQADELSEDPSLQHRRVEVQGRFDPSRQWLLDNRTHQGRFGYEVVTPFQMAATGQWILVNRGWIEASLQRETLPELPVPEGVQRVTGELDDWGSKPFLLQDTAPEPGWPKRVQYLNPEQVPAALGYEVLPWLVHLDEAAPGALTPLPKTSRMGAATHYGYAVQWFGLALVLVVGTLLTMMKIRKESA